MIVVYIAISIVLGMAWLHANDEMDGTDEPIWMSKAKMSENIEELDTTPLGAILFTLVFWSYNFFIIPWAFFGMAGRTMYKLVFKSKKDK